MEPAPSSPRRQKKALHGEIVAVGLFAQLYYNHLIEEKDQLKAYMKSMDMPLTFDELGVESTDENLKILEDYLHRFSRM